MTFHGDATHLKVLGHFKLQEASLGDVDDPVPEIEAVPLYPSRYALNTSDFRY